MRNLLLAIKDTVTQIKDLILSSNDYKMISFVIVTTTYVYDHLTQYSHISLLEVFYRLKIKLGKSLQRVTPFILLASFVRLS